MKENHVTVTAPGQGIIASIEALMAERNEFCSKFLQCELTHAFAVRFAVSEIAISAALLIENLTSFNGWCFSLWLVGLHEGYKMFKEFNNADKEEA